jgi:RNA-directed DNA polymerase
LDATTVVNGPKDAEDWYGIDWDQADRDVRRLRQRIFAASQAGDLKKVRNLQRLMLRSRANALVSVRRVTEVNAGRKTPGIDGKVVLMASQKADLADWCQRGSRLWTARPVRRVLIPKPGSAKKRALGIPAVADRIAQTVVAMYLERLVEPVFHPDSYGYRPGRSALDAVARCRERCWRAGWVIDLDVRAFFDSVDHSLMLKAVQRHTDAKWVLLYVARWLKAPMRQQDGTLAARDRGTPQGGLCSAEHNPPYEQRRVMRSTGLPGLVRSRIGERALSIIPRIPIM